MSYAKGPDGFPLLGPAEVPATHRQPPRAKEAPRGPAERMAGIVDGLRERAAECPEQEWARRNYLLGKADGIELALDELAWKPKGEA